VSINGVVLPSSGDTITGLTWNWGDGASNDSWFPATHRYTANGTFTVQVTARSQAGQTISSNTNVTITTAGDPLCAFSVQVRPAVIALRDGHIWEDLRIEVRDAQGNLVPISPTQITFTSASPSVVRVDNSGRVSATGFGQSRVTAGVEGFPQKPVADVYAGRVRTLPPVLYLSPATRATGKFTLDATNADGTPLDLSKHNVIMQLNGPADVAKMDPDGTITAFRAPQGLRENVSPMVSIDGVVATDNAGIRINDPPFDPELAYWPQQDIVFYGPKVAGHLDNATLLPLFQVPETTQVAYSMEKLVTGVVPWQGDIQYLANYAGPGNPTPANETLPCGGSGNPVGLGTDISKSHDGSCLWIDSNPILPQWGVIFHELGHNVTLGSRLFSNFVFSAGGARYTEGLATLVAMYISARLQELPASATGVSAQRVQEIANQTRFGPSNTLNAYLAKGANYANVDATVLDDMMAVLMSEKGSSWVYRFYSTFLPQNDDVFPFTISTDSQQATFFIAAVSAAIGTDLRSRFAARGFPVDNAFWSAIYSEVSRRAAQRDPVAYAGSNQLTGVGQSVTFGEAIASSFEGNPTVTWRIITKPQGSDPKVSDSLALRPTFTPDLAGSYVLSLTASNGVVAGPPSTVTVDVASALALLNVMETHTGSFTQGQTRATYTVTISNSTSAGPTNGTVTVTETVPTGMTLVSMVGSGWTCPSGSTMCTRSDVLNGGASFPPITVTVNVASNAGTPLSNSVSVSGGGSASSSTENLTSINQLPSVLISGGVVNGASFGQGIAAGAWVTIRGTNLAATTPGRTWRADEIVNGNLPTELDGVSVTINNKPAYVYYISPTQINVQAPSDTTQGPVNVVVRNNGLAGASASGQLQSFAPAFFQYPGTSYAIATRYPDNALIANPSVVSGTVAAKPGDVLILWGTGFGSTVPATPAGVVVSVAAAAETTPMVTAGGVTVSVIGAALSPGSAGLYQVAIQLPDSVPIGDVAVQASAGGFQSPTGVNIYISR
jgi:uncharacterized protein (TIGR03437 family)